MRVLGFMTGTSLDAVDMAVLETDGDRIPAFGPAGARDLSDETRALVRAAIGDARGWERAGATPASFKAAAAAVAREHFEAGELFLGQRGMKWSDLDLIGMHGQTVLHEPPANGARGRTVQLGDALWLARQTGIPVAYDFRAADIAAGGEGAPLAPIYHMSLARKYRIDLPVAALNLGGIGNLTLVRSLEPSDLQAFDTGPGNGMIDQWMEEKTGARFDEGGKAARAGRVNEAALRALLGHPFFAAPPPKSLDRYAFLLDAVRKLSVEDGAATLTAFTAEAVALGLTFCAEPPRMLVVCGGGRRNPALMAAIAACVDAPVKTAEDIGWRGDFIEAEAIALLAARCAHGLPTSFPGTTGVKKPVAGGKIVKP